MDGITRRRFLRVLGVGGSCAAVAAKSGCGSDPPSLHPKDGVFDCGHPDDYSENDLRYFDEAPVLVGLDVDGFYAMSAVCTHRGCFIGDDVGEVAAQGGILCQCHNSIYTRTGEFVSGRAAADLEHFQMSLDGEGRLQCDTRLPVSRETRFVP